MKKLLAILLSTTLVFGLAGCNNQTTTTDTAGIEDPAQTAMNQVAGIYEPAYMETNGEEVPIPESFNQTIAFYPDGSCYFLNFYPLRQEQQFWTSEGDSVMIRMEEVYGNNINEFTGRVDGNTLVIETEGNGQQQKIVCTKVDEAIPDPMVGTYHIASYSKSGEPVSTEEFDTSELVFMANGYCESKGEDGSVYNRFDWTREGNTVTLTYGGDVTQIETTELTLDGNNLILDDGIDKVVFSK